MNTFDNFISAIRKLLSTLFLRDLNSRIANYRRSKSTTPEKELTTALDNLIDSSLANAGRSDKPEVRAGEIPDETRSIRAAAEYSSAQPRQPGPMASPAADTEMKRSRTRSATRIGHGLGGKMWSSAVEHIHAAHRSALKGDSTNARLHATIAKEAIKDAARYMSDDEYEGFIDQVRKQLRSLPE